MQNALIGISIGLALKGISSVKLGENSFNKLQKAIENTGAKAQKLNSILNKIKLNNIKIDGLESKMSNFKSKIGEKLALGASVVMPIKLGVEFESAMARVKALSGANTDEFEKLKQTAKDLGASTTFSAQEVAEGMQFLSMAGFKANETVQTMPGLLALASAGATDLATTSDIASNILTGFGLKASEMGRVADVMALAMRTSNVDTAKLGDTMKYVAPVASGLGASIEEVAALSAKLGDVGIQGSMAGTTLRSMYARMAAPPSEARKMLEELGVSTTTADGKMKDMITIIGELNNRMALMSESEKSEVIKNLFGMEAIGGATALLKQGSKNLRDYEAQLKKSQGSAKKIAKDQNDTAMGDFKALGSVFSGIAINISELLLPSIRSLTQGLTKVGVWINGFIEKYKTLAKIISYAVVGFISFSVILPTIGFLMMSVSVASLRAMNTFRMLRIASSLLFSGLGKLVIAIRSQNIAMMLAGLRLKAAIVLTSAYNVANKALATGFAMLRTAMVAGAGAMKILRLALVSTGIGAIVVGIGIAAAFLIANWDKVKIYFNKFVSWAKGVFGGFIDGVKILFGSIVGFISSVFSPIANVISGVFGSVAGLFSSMFDDIKGAFSSVASWFEGVFGGLFDWFSDKFSWVSDTLKTVTDNIGSVWSGAKSFFGFGNDDTTKQISDQEPLVNKNKEFKPWYQKEKEPKKAETFATKAMNAVNQAINISFNGGINIATSDGKFDMAEFEKAVLISVKRALKFEAMNEKNTSIVG
ncbi:phage tail tape measure protein, TP901 family [Campylobacter pinnipediorum subsp. caledonicus]|uniref:phage tail tape measure protein n=1 Tax=Campylobacter pinnipediorum TaxID=1965231 RepID=UPI00099551E6|nr:phage tail tape measure protein [Campylobacter pinnipediorum]AQW85496.1 phage tail tape measure protein, TP901 family [Campylobacter pinnipediorum subsp. caledonicus]